MKELGASVYCAKGSGANVYCTKELGAKCSLDESNSTKDMAPH